jgi:hypothetical protein
MEMAEKSFKNLPTHKCWLSDRCKDLCEKYVNFHGTWVKNSQNCSECKMKFSACAFSKCDDCPKVKCTRCKKVSDEYPLYDFHYCEEWPDCKTKI